MIERLACQMHWVAAAILISAFEPAIAAQEASEGDALHGKVTELRAELRDLGDADVMATRLTFKMRIENRQAKAVKLGNSSYLTQSVWVRKRGSKEWRQFTKASMFYDEATKAPNCAMLAPGRVKSVDIEAQITNLKRLWPNLAEVEFCLKLEAVCRESGQLQFEGLFTTPFRIDLKLP